MSYQDDTDRWVEAGLIDPETASAIVTFEQEQTQTDGIPGGLEALAYIGAIFMLTATFLVLGQEWDSWSDGGRLAAAAVGTATAVVTGWFVGSMGGAVAERIRSFLWFVSTGFFAATVGLLLDTVLGESHRASFTLAAALALVFAFVLWRRTPTSLQMVALSIAAATTTAALVDLADVEPVQLASIAVAVLGVLWLVGTFRGWLHPQKTSMVMASIGILAIGFPWFDETWVLALGTVGAAALLMLGVRRGHGILVGMGIAGLLVYLPVAMFNIFGDTLGVSLTMLITGGIVLIVALRFGRRGKQNAPGMGRGEATRDG